MIDSRKSSITAKVSAQIVEFNNLALRSLEPSYKEGIVPSRKYKVCVSPTRVIIHAVLPQTSLKFTYIYTRVYNSMATCSCLFTVPSVDNILMNQKSRYTRSMVSL